MLRSAAILILAALIPLASADAQKNCRKGKPCGNTCIAVNKTCRIDGSAGESAPTAEATEPVPLVEEAAWVASSRGSVYYLSSCSAARRLVPENRIYFRTEEEAKSAGYSRSRSKGC
jgi:hypothetical protein